MSPTSFDPVGDVEIRRALRGHLRELHPQARLVDEVGVGYSRIDVAAISEAFSGFEIKSWRDSLKKLDQQARDYSRVFDFCTLCATTRHMDAATEIVPEWWGLLLVTQDDDRTVSLTPHRPMGQNPSLDVRSLAGLLWREELRALLVTHGIARGHANKAKGDLVKMVHSSAPLPVVRSAIIKTLRDRPEWRDENGRAINRLGAA